MLHRNINAVQRRALEQRQRTSTDKQQIQRKGIDMNLTPEQIAAAQKANLETLSGLTNQALQSIEKLVELNMHIAKQSFAWQYAY